MYPEPSGNLKHCLCHSVVCLSTLSWSHNTGVTAAEVQIEDVMCANAFRVEVRLWEQQPQYGKLERRAYYTG